MYASNAVKDIAVTSLNKFNLFSASMTGCLASASYEYESLNWENNLANDNNNNNEKKFKKLKLKKYES